MRVVALGRKNFLFVGHEDAGDNIAGLYSLVATCEANGVNPIEYLRDVLLRISTHPADRIDELLPDRWNPPDLDQLRKGVRGRTLTHLRPLQPSPIHHDVRLLSSAVRPLLAFP